MRLSASMRLSARVLKLLRRSAARGANAPVPIRLRRSLHPTVGKLESRIVLSATAELNPLGQLVVSGSELADTVMLEVDSADRIQLRDATGSVIPIVGHPGDTSDPLAISSITSGQVIIDLGGGDDLLDLQIHAALDVTVLAGEGLDSTSVEYLPSASLPAPRVIEIASESITVDTSQGVVDMRGGDHRFVGNLALEPSANITSLLLDQASLAVDGSVTLAGDLLLRGEAATIDLSQAVLSAANDQSDLRIELGESAGNTVAFGDIGNPSNPLLRSLIVEAANAVTFGEGIFATSGQLSVRQAASIDVLGDLAAGSVSLVAQDRLSLNGDVTALQGDIRLESSGLLDLDGELRTTHSIASPITLIGDSVNIDRVNITTRGGDVLITGAVTVSDALSIMTQSAPLGGKIEISGSLDAEAPSTTGTAVPSVRLDARATTEAGSIVLPDVGGQTVDGNLTLSVLGGLVQLRAIELGTGDLLIDSSGVTVTGGSGLLATSGNIEIFGGFAQAVPFLDVRANDFRLHGVLATQPAAQTFRLVATGETLFADSISGLSGFTVDSNGPVRFGGAIDVQGDLRVASDGSIRVASSSIQTSGSQTFEGRVEFFESGLLSASELTIGPQVDVNAGVSYSISAGSATEQIVKTGEGILIFQSPSFELERLRIAGGIVRVDHELRVSDAVTIVGGTLHGNGNVRGAVFGEQGEVIGGQLVFIRPGNEAGARQVGALGVDSLTLSAGSTIAFQFDASNEHATYDQIIVQGVQNDGLVALGQSLIQLEFITNALAATEYLLIRNDGIDAVSGTFTTMFGADGSPLATARVLTEGSLVLEDFGGSGRAGYITYRGGDGNDVAIVTAGDVLVAADAFTLVERVGSNLEIRTADSRDQLASATPTIRPIAAVNEFAVQIVGSEADEQLLVDLNRIFDPSPGALQFTGEISFVGGDEADLDTISIIDSQPLRDGGAETIEYRFDSVASGSIEIFTTNDLSTSFSVDFAQTESIVQEANSSNVQVRYTAFDDLVTVATDPNVTDRTLFSSLVVGEVGTQLSISNPGEILTIFGDGGNDSFNLNGFGGDRFSAQLVVDGEGGDDSIDLNTDLTLGNARFRGDVMMLAERISIRGDISTTGGANAGDVRLTGGSLIEVIDGASIEAGAGTIVVDANGGAFDSQDGRMISSNAGEAISILNASVISLGEVAARSGALTLTSTTTGGSVEQASGTGVRVERLVANVLGDIVLANEENDIRVVDRLQSSGDVTIRDGAGDLSIVSLETSGAEVSIFAAGDLQLAAAAVVAPNGIVSLDSQGAILDGRDSVQRELANVSGREIQFIAASVGATGRSVVVSATQVVDVSTAITSGDIYLASPVSDLPVGLIDAGRGSVLLSASSIDDAADDAQADVIGSRIQLEAVSGIGNVRQVELQDAALLSAITTSGGIRLSHQSVDKFVVENLSAASGPIQLTHRGSDLATVQRVRSGDGDVAIVHEDGSLAVKGPAADQLVVDVDRASALSLIARGVDSDIRIEGKVTSDSGQVSLLADRDVRFTSLGSIETGAGNVLVRADAASAGMFGEFAMENGAKIVTDQGQVTISADGDVTLGSVQSASRDEAAITITSRSGAILDGGDSDRDVIANRGGVVMTSLLGIGNNNALETSVAIAIARVTDAGPIAFDEADAIELREVVTADGSITITALGTMTATQLTSLNPNAIDDLPGAGPAHRDIQLTAKGDQSDIRVGSIIARNGADVMLAADDDVIDTSLTDEIRIEADDLRVVAVNGSDDGPMAIKLATAVNDLTLNVEGSFAGDVEVFERDAIRLASSDSGSDDDSLETSNGKVSIFAIDTIVINDDDDTNDGADLKGDREISAGGARGQVFLMAERSVKLDGATQIATFQSTLGSIVIEANQVAFGQQVELHTGEGVGIARWFAQRPAPGVAGTAFFDFTTVETNRLTQSGANDATGILSMTMGRPGENGFTINLDWGATSNRFQQIDNLPHNPEFTVSHEYTEADILNSVLNGRDSATAPLQVRFSVRHHESILVNAGSVTQAADLREDVPGGLVSSTDNRDTVALETGTASFVIPNLTIPVAFFPVRQIIPESTQPEVFVRVETATFFAGSTVETPTASASATVSRDEYFQIRILAIEPGGKDLAPPQRLPQDILSGDRLKQLFANLPDGRYEIQYVLGDGNERTLLRVDIRNRQPIVPGDEFEGGKLELKEIDLETLRQEVEKLSAEDDSDAERLPPPSDDSAMSTEESDEESQAELGSMEASLDQVDGNQEPLASVAGVGLATGTLRRRSMTRSGASALNRFSAAGRLLRRDR